MKKENSFLNSLSTVCDIYNKQCNLEKIIDDLAYDRSKDIDELFSLQNRSLAKLFNQASSKVGLKSKLVKKKLSELSKHNLPVILILNDDITAVITEIDHNAKQFKVIDSNFGLNEWEWQNIDIIAEDYSGYSLLIHIDEKNIINSNLLTFNYQHWFWDSLKHSKSIYFDVLLASLLLNIFVLMTPLYTMNIYDRVVPNAAFDTLWVFSIGIVIVYLFDILIKYIRIYLLEVSAKKSDTIILSLLFNHILKSKLFYKFKSVGSFANHFREFDSIRSLVTSTTLIMLIDLPFIFIFLFVIYSIGGNIVFAPLGAMLLIIILAFSIKDPLQRSVQRSSESAGKKQNILIESLNSIETIKAFGLYSKVQYSWENLVGQQVADEVQSRLLSNLMTVTSNFIVQISNVTTIIIGVYLISKQELSMGGLIASYMLSSRAIAPMHQLVTLISGFEHAKNAYHSIEKIMEIPEDNKNVLNFIHRDHFKGDIEFKNVRFKYPNSSQYILDDISFSIKAGEKVSIVGTNGSGKSTLLKLIMGLYEPESGTILIDGIDQKQISHYHLKKNISYIPQEIVLLQGTIYENIVATASVSQELFLDACQASGVDKFINKNSSGYNFEVGERGEMLSGGQKQAIGIARSFIKKDASIIIMDEPTNALDSINENRVEKSLETYIQNKTVIMVTHKQSLLKYTKRLIVIRDGKLLLDGERNAVIAKLSQGVT